MCQWKAVKEPQATPKFPVKEDTTLYLGFAIYQNLVLLQYHFWISLQVFNTVIS